MKPETLIKIGKFNYFVSLWDRDDKVRLYITDTTRKKHNYGYVDLTDNKYYPGFNTLRVDDQIADGKTIIETYQDQLLESVKNERKTK